MLESLVDLTYRGISLSRRIKLTQVRRSSGYLELASPMPVGTELAIVADDGVSFGATVAWVNEQVTGSDRTPGMMIVPRLTAEAAASWWQARVVLGDDDAPRPRLMRNRPVTVRPRTHTQSAPPSVGAPSSMSDTPAILADLDARVAAAAGVGSRPRAPSGSGATTALDGELMRPGEHVVVDDGAQTLTMVAVDPATFEVDPGTSGSLSAQGALPDDGEDPGDVAAADGPEQLPPPGNPKRKRRR